ncbi:MAG: hypothetical protein H5T83_01035 [Actinotalea sp.]|nr:hypothetical protein [Actinotalea sp.]
MAEDPRAEQDRGPRDSSTDPTEERTMDEVTTSTPGVTGAPAPAGTTRRPADDDAPWSVAADPAPTGAVPTTATSTAPPIARGVRLGTVVWGLVVVAVGVLLAAAAAGVVFDVQLAVIVTVALAGVALVVGSLVSASRRRTRDT